MGFDTSPDHVIAIGAAFVAICPLIVGLRFYSRIRQRSGLGIDDYLTIPALLMAVGCGIDLIIGVKFKVYGYPTPRPSGTQNAADFVSWNFTIAEKLQVAFLPMQAMAMGLVKLSFVFLFRRIFVVGQSNSRFSKVTWGTVAVIILWLITFLFWQLFSCGSHFTARWQKPKVERTQCSTGLKDMYGLAISDFLTDVFIYALPLPMVWRLNMKINQKFAVLGIFGFASLTIVVSIIRLAIFLHDLKISHELSSKAGLDQILIITQALYWSMLEAGLALIACCLPPIIGLARRCLTRDTISRSSRFSDQQSSSTRCLRQGSVSMISSATTLTVRDSAFEHKHPHMSDHSCSTSPTVCGSPDEIVAPGRCHLPTDAVLKEKLDTV